MNLSDLVLILSFFVLVFGLLGLLFALVSRRRRLLRSIFLGLVIYVSLYSLLLISVSLLSPQQVLAMHQLRCFDDWCASVEGVEQQPAIGAVQAQGTFYLVSVQVTSRARRITQRALDAAVYLLDEQGRRYDPAPAGQQALETSGQAGQPLDSRVGPGSSFTSTLVFDLPPETRPASLVHTHGTFPGVLIIGDPQSFLHKPTIVRLPPP